MSGPARAARWSGLALAATLLIGIGWGAHAPHSWDVDNIAPGSVLRAMQARFGPEWYSSYGPLPYQIVAVVYAPALAAQKVTGELGSPSSEYPWGYRHPDFSMGLLIVLARLVSVAMALGVAWLAVRERWIPPLRGAVLAPLLLLGSPAFVYYARTTNVDLYYLFFLAAAFHLAERAEGWRGFLAAGIASALAVCCKEQSAPLAAAAGLGATWRAWRTGAANDRAKQVAAVLLGGILAYVLVWGLPFHAAGWAAHHRFLFEQARYPREFPATLSGALGLARRALEQLPVTLGWPVVLGVPLAVAMRARLSGLGARAWGQLLYLGGFLAVIGYVYPRFLLPAMLLALPLALRGWDALLDRAPRLRAAVWLLLVVLAGFGGPLLGAAQLRDSRVEATERLGKYARDAGVGRPTLALVGNPRFLPTPPEGYDVRYVEVDSLRRSGEGPRADLVMISSFERYQLEGDALLRRTWMDRLEDPAGDYRLLWDIPPPRWSRPVRGLPFSPVIWTWERRRPQP